MISKKTIGILAVLATLILAALISASIRRIKESARRRMCWSNLTANIGLAFNLYAADHDGKRPKHLTRLTKYVGGEENAPIFICPSGVPSDWSKKYPHLRISDFKDHPDLFGYLYLASTGLGTNALNPHIVPLMCDKPGNHGKDGINILMASGETIWWPGTLEEYANAHSLSITAVTNWVQ